MRECDLAISSWLLRRLRAAADLLGYPNAEGVAEVWLSERIKAIPEIEELIQEQSRTSQKIREQWIQKQNEKVWPGIDERSHSRPGENA